MQFKKPVSMAVSSACLMSVGAAHGADAYSVKELCGTTLTESTYIPYCSTWSEELEGDCKIKVAEGYNLSINNCYVDADGFEFAITGEAGANLSMDNGSVTSASKIDIKFDGYDQDEPDWNCYQNVVDIEDFELSAETFAGGGKVSIKTGCGSIRIDRSYDYDAGETAIRADDDVDIKTDFGNISIWGNYYNSIFVGAALDYDQSGGNIKMHAGGASYYDGGFEQGGNVRTNCVDMSAGSISIKSDGNAPYVGCY